MRVFLWSSGSDSSEPLSLVQVVSLIQKLLCRLLRWWWDVPLQDKLFLFDWTESSLFFWNSGSDVMNINHSVCRLKDSEKHKLMNIIQTCWAVFGKTNYQFPLLMWIRVFRRAMLSCDVVDTFSIKTFRLLLTLQSSASLMSFGLWYNKPNICSIMF